MAHREEVADQDRGDFRLRLRVEVGLRLAGSSDGGGARVGRGDAAALGAFCILL